MHVVITGSSKGIGKALAQKFLDFGDKVIISSRSQDAIDSTVAEFENIYGPENVFGIPCDVVQAEDIEQLISFAVNKFGTIDIWINNAGLAGNKRAPLIDLDVSQIRSIIETNVIGTLLCCRAVLKIMIDQGFGHIFNMEGAGSHGRPTANLLPYVTSKSAIPIIKKTLLLETKNLSKRIGIHDLRPGIVLTDMLLKVTPDLKSKQRLNVLAEKPKTIADYLVPRIRKVKGSGKNIYFLSAFKIMIRILTASKAKNKFFDEHGNPVE
ncbi:3-phenylpropionate-dihydrodiol/cinnamic acid-dihydrodiol dehydrogenase [Candidatus Lokiarchaeum ossiferum]|uniref:3-phenylpropionate-dihydrodiol/cinnamic acid-dihydrodiol dehydrogenase n=1 Tax=Candidatus Lokiarchaeum ossiferum TaxID=2951803 RepID=A0ABY6HMP8_9ARCH|nr:3-phenylpropionate-dihydrodiol/cinnamic acid-dihydrodiol dehydrogenase [Candidatus Lokiarchaeum sp. B-35]